MSIHDDTMYSIYIIYATIDEIEYQYLNNIKYDNITVVDKYDDNTHTHYIIPYAITFNKQMLKKFMSQRDNNKFHVVKRKINDSQVYTNLSEMGIGVYNMGTSMRDDTAIVLTKKEAVYLQFDSNYWVSNYFGLSLSLVKPLLLWAMNDKTTSCLDMIDYYAITSNDSIINAVTGSDSNTDYEIDVNNLIRYILYPFF